MKSQGFTIVEFIVAAGIFVIIATSSVVALLHSGMIDRKGSEQEKARRYAQEGVEATRSIRNQNFNSLAAGPHGVSFTSGTWAFSGTQNVNAGMTRQIAIADVYRDGSDTIVTSGGTPDEDTKKATVTVTWATENGKQQTVTQESYLTNFKKTTVGCGEWDSPTQESSINLSGDYNGAKITTQGNYAYMTRESGSPDFIIVDITDTANPQVRGTLNLDGGQNNIAVMGDYAYIASGSDSKELQIINIANPNAPQLVGSYNTPGEANGLGIYLNFPTAYLSKASSAYHEFVIFDVSNPANPDSIGSLNLNEGGTAVNSADVIVMGNYAYLATSHDSQEFWVVNVSNPETPVTKNWYNIPGTVDGHSVTGYNGRIFLGLDEGGVYIFNVSNPSSLQLLGSYDAGDDVESIALSPDYTCLFLGTDYDDAQFQVVNVANPAAPFLTGSLLLSDGINGVAYHSGKNRTFLSTKANSTEFIDLQPQ